ncbi:hypothetical protein CR513_35403, partial [Mucuna pruriens]
MTKDELIRVAPTQLHPNRWASMQAFCMVCRVLSITPTTRLFLSYYTTKVSLSLLPKGGPFNVFLASYKGFKNRCIKVVAVGDASFSNYSESLPLY